MMSITAADVMNKLKDLGIDLIKYGWRVETKEMGHNIFPVDAPDKAFYVLNNDLEDAINFIYGIVYPAGPGESFVNFYFNYRDGKYYVKHDCLDMFMELNSNVKYTEVDGYLVIAVKSGDKTDIICAKYTNADSFSLITAKSPDQSKLYAKSGLLEIPSIEFRYELTEQVTMDEKYNIVIPNNVSARDYILECDVQEKDTNYYIIIISIVKLVNKDSGKEVYKFMNKSIVRLHDSKLEILPYEDSNNSLPTWTNYVNHQFDFCKNPNNRDIWDSHLSNSSVEYDGEQLFVDTMGNAYVFINQMNKWIPVNVEWLHHYCNPQELTAYLALKSL